MIKQVLSTVACMLMTLGMQAHININMSELQSLTPRQLSLAECACLEAQGDMEKLGTAIRNALNNGVTVHELKEAFSQLYAYTGFPRSLNALNKLKAVLDERKQQGIIDKEGKPAIALRPGDIIDIPEGVKHWHGAQKDSWFQHIATHVKTAGEERNEWLEAVSEEEYQTLK